MFNRLTTYMTAIAFALTISFTGNVAWAGEYPMQQKLKQCEAQFKISRDKNITRNEASIARSKHLNMMVDILQHLNDQNMAKSNRNEPLSPQVVIENFRVMGHLLQMLAKDRLAPQPDY